LEQYLNEEWNAIPKELCQKLALSFRKRAKAVCRAKENYTDYQIKNIFFCYSFDKILPLNQFF
jgi:hypothetical protein